MNPTDQQHQYDRATPEDLEWLEGEVRDAEYTARQLETDEWVRQMATERGRDPDRLLRAHRIQAGHSCRILNSLRAAPAVPDREALARALYLMDGGPDCEEARALFWTTDLVAAERVRNEWLAEADRLLRILGGCPAVPERPHVSGVVFLLRDEQGRVLMEKCPKKAARHGGEWFIPGGRVEDEDRRGAEAASAEVNALYREMWEELRARPLEFSPLPIIDACGGPGWPSFLMQPYLVTRWEGEVPAHTLDHPDVPLRWMEVEEAASSPSAALRAMLASAIPAAPEAGTPLARIEALQAEVEKRGLVGEFDSTPPEVALLRALDGSEASLDYVATAFHLTYHGIKEAPTWRECERQPCRVASGRLKPVHRVDPRPPTDATPAPEPASDAPSP